MKNLLSIVCIVITSITLISCDRSYTSALAVSQDEWDQLTSDFRAKNQKETYGGCIHKADLLDFLKRLPSSCDLVYFMYTEDDRYHKTSLAFSGGSIARQVTCIRNGGDESAFCPTACDPTVRRCPRAVMLSFDDYRRLGAAYYATHPGEAAGGNIDRSALMEIINSLESDVTGIFFHFCIDPSGRKSVIFKGGTRDQPSGEILYLRNGASDESFCPTACGD